MVWPGLKPAQAINLDSALQTRRRLLDKGLFRRVEIDTLAPCSNAAEVIIKVKENHYHIANLQLIHNGNCDVAAEIRYRGSDLFGRDHSLMIGNSSKGFANGESTDSRLITFQILLISMP